MLRSILEQREPIRRKLFRSDTVAVRRVCVVEQRRYGQAEQEDKGVSVDSERCSTKAVESRFLAQFEGIRVARAGCSNSRTQPCVQITLLTVSRFNEAPFIQPADPTRAAGAVVGVGQPPGMKLRSDRAQ